MKLQLNKKKLKNLSKDAQILPSDMTPNIAGGEVQAKNAYRSNGSCGCISDPRIEYCNTNTCY